MPKLLAATMQSRSPISVIAAKPSVRSGHALVAVGIGVLVLASWLPSLPVISAMSCIALGATPLTIARLSANRHVSLFLFAHIVVYGILYLFLTGAMWHATDPGLQSVWRFSRWIDFALSVCIMALAASRTLSAIALQGRGGDATFR